VQERNRIGQLPDWMSELLQLTIAGYQGVPGNIASLIRALGFHAASEMLADHEYRLIDKAVRENFRGRGFDAYLRETNSKVELEGRKYSSWYWVVVHGKFNDSGVEAEHFELALEALVLAARYRPEPDIQLRLWAMQGFAYFIELQQRLFREIHRECQQIC